MSNEPTNESEKSRLVPVERMVRRGTEQFDIGVQTSGDYDALKILVEERDRYRKVLEQIANDGCGLHDYDTDRTCRDRWENQEDWCWCCIAKEALKDA